MKKLIILIILCVTSILSFGQTKTKKIPVADNNSLIINGYVNFDETNTPQDTVYMFMGRDVRYKSIVELIILKEGGIEDIKELLNKCMEAFNEDDGTSLNYGESTIYVSKLMGVKNVSLYGVGKDSRGYCYLSKNWITKLLGKIEAHQKGGK